jgi:excisionase family DNA binding protein
MQLTLEQAATRLGKSKRQILYMIQQGHLPAQKLAGRWWIESQHLPLSEVQQRSYDSKQHQLRAAVEDALDIEPENTRPRRYSVRDLKAFQIALPLHRKAQAAFGADDSSADTMPPAVS